MQKNSDEEKKQANRVDRAVQKGLMQIYSNSDGSLPDISHLEVRRKGRFTALVLAMIGLVAIVGGIAWLGYNLFTGNNGSASHSLEMTISGQENVASGDVVTYVLEYKNIESVPLRELEFIFRFPDGFTFESANPPSDNDTHTTWTIGDVAVGGTGRIEITGSLIGEVGSIRSLSTTASFRPDNFSSVFKETQTFRGEITSSILELQLTGPSETLTEKKVTYTITYKNNAEQDLENIRIQVEYPPHFVFQESTPAPFSREDDARQLNNQWIITTLGAKQEGTIEISGGYVPEDGVTTATFKAQIGFVDQASDTFSLQQEQALETELIDPRLSLDLIINGSAQSQPISFEEALNYAIVYKNLGQKELDDVVISITIDGAVADIKKVDDANNGTLSGNTITWTKDELPALDVLRPLDEGTIDFVIPVVALKDAPSGGIALIVTSKASATMQKIGELEVTEVTVESDEIINAINTDVELQVTGRYFDDDNIAVGTGPLPPVVGQKTSFRIYWSIANSLHELTDTTVSATLPKGVAWENKFLTNKGKVSFSSANNTITWSLDTVDPNQSFDDVALWFDVSVTPTKQQTGKLLILIDQPVLSGTDTVTESVVTKTGKAVTSNLEDDVVGGGRGLVVDISE